MKQLLFIAALLSCVAAHAQSSDYEIGKDEETGSVVFKGQLSFEDLKKESSFNWMKTSAEYKPVKQEVKFLKDNLKAYNLVVFIGTWCDDSQRLIPQLYKVLQAAGYPVGKVTIYGVNRDKETKNIEHKLYRILKVPTIILTKNNVEAGRIVEHVTQTIERDLVELISNDNGGAN